MFTELVSAGWMVIGVAALGVGVAAILIVYMTGVVRYIPNDRIGVIEKLWSSSGSVKSGLLALHGEAGFQPELRRGGFHFFAPLQYRVHIHQMVSVTQGKLDFGTWQQVYYAEFDGQRPKRVLIKVMGE